MGQSLRIGEVADLLGITTKTIRHYHRLGLLAEPERTQAGYRLYAAADVLRLLRVRRLQRLGLTLVQIRPLLGTPELDEGSLRRVLEHIAGEVDAQIGQLQARRDRIQRILAREALGNMDYANDTPPLLEFAAARLLEHGIVPSEAAWEQDRAIFGALDELHIPDDDRMRLNGAVARVLENPELMRRVVEIGERFVALAGEDPDSPAVACLVEDALSSGWLEQLQQLQPPGYYDPGDTRDSSQSSDVLGMLLSELTTSALAPAQLRFIERMQAHQRGQ